MEYYISSGACTIRFPREEESKYEESSPERILEYLESGNESGQCYDKYGQPLTGSSRRELIGYAKEIESQRVGTISLHRGDKLDDLDYRQGASRFFCNFAKDRPSLKVAWTVHRDTEQHHVHFAFFGDWVDCHTAEEDLEQMHRLARDSFHVDYGRRCYVDEYESEYR